MRYKAVFTDEFLSDFRLDDNGKTLVLTDRQGFTRAVPLEVEVEPKHSRWINDNGLYRCTACNGLCTVAGWADCIPEEQMYKRFKFCPNCGARMDADDCAESKINPCIGCEDYDGRSHCKSHCACVKERNEE